MTLEELLDLTTKEFAVFVRDNVGNDDDGLWEPDEFGEPGKLMHPSLIASTRQALVNTHVDIESQLGQRKARIEEFQNTCFSLPNGKEQYLEARADYNNWKRRTLGYKRLVRVRTERIQEAANQAVMNRAPHATTKKGGLGPQPNVPKIQHNIRSLYSVAYGLFRHREACMSAGIIPEPHDVELWDLLDDVEVFTTEHGAHPIIEWLERTMSKPDWAPPNER